MQRAYLRLKACPKCGGDILIDRAIEDAEVCLQCGFRNFGKVISQTHPQPQLGETVTVVKGQANSKVVEKVS